MYVPDAYRPRDPSWALEIVRAHPLALLAGSGPDGPLATHLPVVPDEPTVRDGTGDTGLVGVTLLGHLNRRNPHWALLATGAPALLVFQGPHAYVTPTVYEATPAAPTWDFVAVHAHGTVRPIAGRAETLEVVRATVRAFERDHGTGWDMTASLPYFEEIIGGVGAFRFTVTAAEAMFKLSQEQPDDRRARVLGAFSGSASDGDRRVAAAMRRYGRATRI